MSGNRHQHTSSKLLMLLLCSKNSYGPTMLTCLIDNDLTRIRWSKLVQRRLALFCLNCRVLIIGLQAVADKLEDVNYQYGSTSMTEEKKKRERLN